MRARLKKQNRYKSFTLVELIIVVVIVGILSGLGVIYYRKVVVRTKAAKAKHALALAAKAESIYKLNNGAYIAVASGAVEATIGTAVTGINLAVLDNDTDFTYSVTAAGVVRARNTAAIGSCAAGTRITFNIPTGVVNVPACYK